LISWQAVDEGMKLIGATNYLMTKAFDVGSIIIEEMPNINF